MGVLSNLEPASVFYYFEEICGIPHTSHHEKALSDYCVQFAKAHGLACRQDEMGNVLIKAPATPGYEKEPGLILQGHLDMVGDKTADCPLDLEKDAIHPVVDGGYVCAEGTTLGGDDGIAVAYALAVLDAKDIPHPALEVVLTVCEEVGLLGASAMDFSDLEGRILVNIDSEEEGVLTAGCAGGRRVECHLPIARVPVTGTAVKADVIGLVGGHSGTEIHKGRANAIALLGRWLTLLTEMAWTTPLWHCPAAQRRMSFPKKAASRWCCPQASPRACTLLPLSSPHRCRPNMARQTPPSACSSRNRAAARSAH